MSEELNNQSQPESVEKRKISRKAAVIFAAGVTAVGLSIDLASKPTTAFGKEVTPRVAIDNSGSGDKYGLDAGGVIKYNSRGGHALTVKVNKSGSNGLTGHAESGPSDGLTGHVESGPDNGLTGTSETSDGTSGLTGHAESGPSDGLTGKSVPESKGPGARGGHARALNPNLKYDNYGHVVPDESHLMPAE